MHQYTGNAEGAVCSAMKMKGEWGPDQFENNVMHVLGIYMGNVQGLWAVLRRLKGEWGLGQFESNGIYVL